MKIHYYISKMEHVPIYTLKIHLHLRLTTYFTQRTEQTWWIHKVDVLADHMNVSDHLPVVAELKIKKTHC